MITDPTGVTLIPGNNGRDCFGNGEHTDSNGHLIECCCDECSYYLCCCPDPRIEPSVWPDGCKTCAETDCPHAR